MSKTYRLGVIGFAHMHVNGLINEFNKLDNIQWVSCADTVPDVPPISKERDTRGYNVQWANEKIGIPKVYEDYKEMLDKETQPPGRYGALHLEGDLVRQFQEKPDGDNAWINGGFFVLEPSVCDLIDDDACVFEADVLPDLAARGELSAFRHSGFWQPMDTLRERNRLEALWDEGQTPWKLWA